MWVGNEDLPQRQRQRRKQGSSSDSKGGNEETTIFDREDTQDVAHLSNPELRSSAEPGCSYECEPIPSHMTQIQDAASLISPGTRLQLRYMCSADLDHTADIQIHACELFREASCYGHYYTFCQDAHEVFVD